MLDILHTTAGYIYKKQKNKIYDKQQQNRPLPKWKNLALSHSLNNGRKSHEDTK